MGNVRLFFKQRTTDNPNKTQEMGWFRLIMMHLFLAFYVLCRFCVKWMDFFLLSTLYAFFLLWTDLFLLSMFYAVFLYGRIFFAFYVFMMFRYLLFGHF